MGKYEIALAIVKELKDALLLKEEDGNIAVEIIKDTLEDIEADE